MTRIERPAAGRKRARLLDLQLDARLAHADPAVLDAIQTALAALDRDPPAVELASNRRRHVEDVLSGATTFRRLVLGAMVPMAAILAVLFQRVSSNDVLDAFRFDVWSRERVALLGAGGAFISILLRIPDFTGLSAAQVNTQFYPGLFRPIVGVAFALFVSCVLQSGLVRSPLILGSKDPSVTTSCYFAAAFLAGFSERLAPVLASRAELALAGPNSAAVPNSSHSRAA